MQRVRSDVSSDYTSCRDVRCPHHGPFPCPLKGRPPFSFSLRLSLLLAAAWACVLASPHGALAVSVHRRARGVASRVGGGRGPVDSPLSVSRSTSSHHACPRGHRPPVLDASFPSLLLPLSTPFSSLSPRRPSSLAFVSTSSPLLSRAVTYTGSERLQDGGKVSLAPPPSSHSGYGISFRESETAKPISERSASTGALPLRAGSGTGALEDGVWRSARGVSTPGRSRFGLTRRQAPLTPDCVSLSFPSCLRSLSSFAPASSSLRSSDNSGAAEAEAEALHRLAGLEMWGEMLSLGAASSLLPPPSRPAGAASSAAPHANPPPPLSAFLDSRGEPASPLPLYVAQLPSGEALLQQQRASLSSSQLTGHQPSLRSARKSWLQTRKETEQFRNSLVFLALPLDTLLFYLVVSPSDGVLFLQDGGPYLLLQHLELERERLLEAGKRGATSTPALDLYDLRYAHHCIRQKVCQAALRLRSQLEAQLLERESSRALEAAMGNVGTAGDRAQPREAENETLETVEGGVRGYYRLACRLVDQFFAALYARLPRRGAGGVKAPLATEIRQDEREPSADLMVRREEKEALLAPARARDSDGEKAEAELTDKLRRTTLELKKIWEVYRQRLFSQEEVPPFERLEILWNANVAPLLEIREAQGLHAAQPHGDRTEKAPETVSLLLRLPSLVFHTALAENEDHEGRATVLKWVTLKAMLRIYELLSPDAYTLAGGTDLEALRRALKKKMEKLVEAERRAQAMRGLRSSDNTVDTAEEDEAIAEATSPSAGLVASASLRRKRLEIFETLEEQETREREKLEKLQRDQLPPGTPPTYGGLSPETQALLFPFEWIEGPWLDAVLAKGQEKRLLGSWLGGASRRHSGPADLFEHLLRSQAALSPSEGLRFVSEFLARYPRRPGLSEVQATAALRASEAEARDREQDARSRGKGETPRDRRGERAPAQTKKALSQDEEDGEGVFPVQQRALAGALLVGALDKAAGVIEPVSSRLHAQIVSTGRQLVHLRERVERGKGKSFLEVQREEREKREDERRRRRREQGRDEEKGERADAFLLKAEEKRGGDGFLDSQQRILLAQLKRQQDGQAALLNLVERQMIAVRGVETEGKKEDSAHTRRGFLFLDEAVRFLRPSETSAALDLAALSSSYSPEDSERQKRSETLKQNPHVLLDSRRVLQTFVEAQLFIYDVFRSLRVVLHQQRREAETLEALGGGAGPGAPKRGDETHEKPSPRPIPFPSLASLRAQGEKPVESDGEDSAGEAPDALGAYPSGCALERAWPASVALDPAEVPLFVENLIRFYRKEIFDDMLPASIQLSLASHIHDLSAVAFLPTLAPRIHPLAIPIQAVSAAIGETGGRPWHMQWRVYIHEALRDPALLAYAVLTALFDIWKRTALPPRLPFAAQRDSATPQKDAAFPSPPSVAGPDSGALRAGPSESLQVSPEMAEAQRRSAADLEAREALAEQQMHPVGCCQGLRKWLWIRRVSEENGWPFYVGMFRTEFTSDLGVPDSQADATASFTPWLKNEEEALLLGGCTNAQERQVVNETLQNPASGVSAAPASLFARLVANGLPPARAASLLALLVRRSSPLPHAFPASHVPLNYDPRTTCPYREAAETASKLQKGVDYDASAASDELSRFRGGRDDDDEEEEQRYGKDVGPTTEKTLTAAEAAAAVARAGTGEQAAEAERQGMFPELYRHWTGGKTLARAATYALWGGAKFEAAAAAGAAASGPDVLNEEERKREEAINLWMVKAGEKRMKDAAEAAFRLRLRESVAKGPVHSDECINSPAFLCRLTPPVGALAPSEAELSDAGSRPAQQQFSSLLHKQTAEFLTDMVLVDHQLEHARRMRAVRALAATKNGGDCPEVFEQLLGDAVQQQTLDKQLLRGSFTKEDLDQLCLGTEAEKKAAEAGKRRLDACRAEVQAGQQLARLHGREREDAARDLFHYFNLQAFHHCLPPETRIQFSAELADRSQGSSLHPALSDFQQNTSDFREPPTIRLAGSIRSLPVLAHALIQQCVLLAASCYDFPSKLHLSPPASVARYLWQYLPPGKAQQKHFAPPPPSGCFSNAGSPHLPPSLRPGQTRGVTPLPASFSDKPPSIASLMNFASQVPSLMQQQQSLGAACRELGKPGSSQQELNLQSKVMAKAKEAAASLSKIEKEFEDACARGDSEELLRSEQDMASGASVELSDGGNISHHWEAEKDIFVEAANAVRAAATGPNGIPMEGAGEEAGADAVMDAIKQEKVYELQQMLLKLATHERWPFYVEAPGTTKAATQNSAVGAASFQNELGGGVQSPPDWQELLNPDEMLKVLKYAVVDREGVASPSLYSDLILSGACSAERAMQIMEQALTVQADNNSVTRTEWNGGSSIVE